MSTPTNANSTFLYNTIPKKVSRKDFNRHLAPHLKKPLKGPKAKLSLYKIFNYILYVLHTGFGLPLTIVRALLAMSSMDKKTVLLAAATCLLLSSCAPLLARRAAPLVARRVGAMVAGRVLARAAAKDAGQAAGQAMVDELPLGPYRVIHDTKLFREPWEDADPVAWLREGTRVNVVEIVEGKWLRVESFHPDKPPGYLRREDAIAVQKESESAG